MKFGYCLAIVCQGHNTEIKFENGVNSLVVFPERFIKEKIDILGYCDEILAEIESITS